MSRIRRTGERGTASLEVVLVMPVIVVLFAVLVVMGQVHLMRLRLEGAGALAAGTFSTQRGLGKSSSEADTEARARIAAAYFVDDQIVQVSTVSNQPFGNPIQAEADRDEEPEADSDAGDFMANVFLPFGESRQTTTIRVKIQPLMLPRVFAAREAQTRLVMDYTPWTFDEWGILSRYRIPVDAIATLMDVLLWPLGFVGEPGCSGGTGS